MRLLLYQLVGIDSSKKRKLLRRKNEILPNYAERCGQAYVVLAALVSSSDQLLIIEARSFLREKLRVSCDHVADCKTTLFTALIDESPSLLALFTADLLHLRVTAGPSCKWRYNTLGIAVRWFLLVRVFNNRRHVVFRPRKMSRCDLQ
jgi:hypothetical protein